MSIAFDPPDPHLFALAAQINKKARRGKVYFCAKGGDVSAILMDGPRRTVLALGGYPSETDIDDMVQALESCAGFQADVPLYSIELPPSPESGWS